MDRRASSQNARQGYFIDARVTPFAGFSDSASGVQAMLDARGYLSLTSDQSIVLAGRLQVGSVIGSPIDETSPDLLFFSGGSGTVRGQPFESLGIPVGNQIAGAM